MRKTHRHPRRPITIIERTIATSQRRFVSRRINLASTLVVTGDPEGIAWDEHDAKGPFVCL